ncbi:DMT family transporter [Parasphingorhabdus sp. DH2-15]|uniref:DMT family transporter n=1 Tax=Parasphingorhabdus sp. DH2-15 TaxID=3444112 RepID=UPI003F688492
MNAWMLLAVAIIFEILGTSLLKASDGFTRWGIGAASIACYWICFAFLAVAIKSIPVGVAYAIWSGVGIVAITIIGFVVFRQNLGFMQIGCIALIAIGAIGLNLTTPAHNSAPQAETLAS